MTLDELVDKLAVLEKEKRFQEINDLIAQIAMTGDLLVNLTLELYKRGIYRTALGLVEYIDQAGINHAVVDFAAAHMGVATEDDRWLDRFERRWQGRYDVFRNAFPAHAHAREREIPPLVAAAFEPEGSIARLPPCLRLARIVDPEVERLFPTTPRPPRPPQPADADAPVPSQARLAETLPPVARRSRRVAVVVRKWWSDSRSRAYEIGPRMTRAFTAEGWDAVFVPLESVVNSKHFHAAFDTIEAMARNEPVDAVFFDQFGCPINKCAPASDFTAFADRLRALRPDAKIVPIYLDPWQRQAWPDLREASRVIDALWSGFPTLEIWHESGIAGKAVVLPFPIGLDVEAVKAQGEPIESLSFVGSVYQYNFYRGFWIAAAAGRDFPIHLVRKTHHLKDGLSAMTSYRMYLETLKSERYPINFSMRQDGSRVYSGRSMEAIALGRCLVQERTMDFHEFYVPGRHYLQFDTIDDLADIAKFIQAEPGKAAAIAAEGRAFAREHYADAKIVELLERMLWGKAA